MFIKYLSLLNNPEKMKKSNFREEKNKRDHWRPGWWTKLRSYE